MRNRIGIVSIAVAVVAVSCSGAEPTDEPTTAPATEPTTSVATTNAAPSTTVVEAAVGGDTEFCQLMSAQDTAMETIDIFDPTSVEGAHREALEAIDRARDLVPGDIRGEYDTLVSAFEDLVLALEESDWDMTATSETDPRILRMGSDEVLAATNALIGYCELEPIGADTGAAAPSPDAESGADSGLPDDLVAPGAVFRSEGSSGIKFFSSAASFVETVAYYERVLGKGPVDVGGAVGYRVASFLSDTPVDVLVQVQEGSGELMIYITLTG